MPAKSMLAPGTCMYLAINPSNSLVVASPRILGPTTLNTVLSTAISATIASWKACGRR